MLSLNRGRPSELNSGIWSLSCRTEAKQLPPPLLCRRISENYEGRISAGGVDRDVAFVDADEDVGDAVDAAYREKYGRYSGYVEPMVRPEARATTIELVPRSPSS